MSWTSERRVKLTILRRLPQEDDWTISFFLIEANRRSFETLLLNYLTFCDGTGALIDIDSQDDTETGEQLALAVKIYGNRAQLAQEIHRRRNEFQACSHRVD